MKPVILCCPDLKRDLTGILSAVPDAEVYLSPLLSDGYRGCTEGHQAIVRMAMSMKAPSVWVIEDDCLFTEYFDRNDWDECAEWAEANGFPMMIGGSVSTKFPSPTQYPGLFAVDKFKSTHCIVYFKTAYETVLKVGNGPIDKEIGKIDGRAAITWPFMAIQQSGLSATLKTWIDYGPEYKNQQNRLRELTPPYWVPFGWS